MSGERSGMLQRNCLRVTQNFPYKFNFGVTHSHFSPPLLRSLKPSTVATLTITIMPPKRRSAVNTQRKLTDTLKASKKRRVIQKPIDLSKKPAKSVVEVRSPSPSEDITAKRPVANDEDEDEFNKSEEVIHQGIDDDLELRKRRQPTAKAKVIESKSSISQPYQACPN
jgi:hypothetical protein